MIHSNTDHCSLSLHSFNTVKYSVYVNFIDSYRFNLMLGILILKCYLTVIQDLNYERFYNLKPYLMFYVIHVFMKSFLLRDNLFPDVYEWKE